MKKLDLEHDLFSFAFCGDRKKQFEPVFLRKLAELAEPENWTSQNSNGHQFDILFYYVLKTFEHLSRQGGIVYSDKGDFAVFNTGLMTPNAEDIYGYFFQNTKPEAQQWFLKGFAKESDRLFGNYKFKKPPVAKYDSDIEAFHFNAAESIELNADHIFDDHWDDSSERYPKEITTLGKNLAIASIRSAFEITKKRLLRNPRLAVPQYYRNKIMFLLPLSIETTNGEIIMALAVEKTSNGSYRANTIFDIPSAYKKARLITKPESNWLIEK